MQRRPGALILPRSATDTSCVRRTVFGMVAVLVGAGVLFLALSVIRDDGQDGLEQLLWKLPTWLALLGVPAAAMLIVRMPRRERV